MAIKIAAIRHVDCDSDAEADFLDTAPKGCRNHFWVKIS